MLYESRGRRRTYRGLVAAFLACLLTLGGAAGMAVHAAGHVENIAKQGVSVVGSRVFIDGVEIDPGVERYTSPASGDVYRIQHKGGAVAVVLERSGNKRGGVTRIESHASGRGATVNAGQVVITTGQ